MTTALLEPPTRLPEFFEVVHGDIIEVPPMGFYAVEIANLLNAALYRYFTGHEIGRVRMEMLFKIPLPNDRSRNCRPDVAVVLFDRWPRNKPLSLTGNAIDVVPNIAVEVISPTDLAEAVTAKAMEYLDGGVQLVWQIYPEGRILFAHRPGGETRRVRAEEEITADGILPDFRVRLADLLPEVAPE